MAFLKRLLGEAKADNITGEAAKVAYYLFLSLFPLLLVVFALTGFLGGERAFAWITTQLEGMVPPETAAFLERYIRQVTGQPEAGALGLGVVLTLWAASTGVAALADGLNRMYDVEESRPFWKKRLVALGLLVVGSVLVVGGAVAILAGPALAGALGAGAAWNVLRWPAAFVLVAAVFYLIYRFLPNRDQAEVRGLVLAGSAIGAAIWLGATLLFRLYVANFGSYTETYGFVGAIIVLMLWLYLTALSILLGGEVASLLEGSRRRGRRHAAGRREARRAA